MSKVTQIKNDIFSGSNQLSSKIINFRSNFVLSVKVLSNENKQGSDLASNGYFQHLK